MAEVRKNENDYKNFTIKVKEKKKDKKKEEVVVKKEEVHEEKKSLWTKIMIFFTGVKDEFKRVHWTSKEDMVKYSIATIIFIIFCAIFFYLIDIIFAAIQSLVG